ncbi:hypothetical protein [Deinococcus sp.]|uniref:hypothetical protein n=1 Tax=Deinococcus sp. TaxID=47478 RepID=UPI0025C68D20|nr:hypothetical protein [Deinococcus sp.]
MTTRTSVLRTLFPGHPDQHLCWTHSNPDGSKEIRYRRRGAKNDDYERHLHPDTVPGPGALGVMPGVSRRGRLVTSWAMLDLDTFTPEALAALRGALDSHELPYLLTTGTTGRGAHLWFLLSEPITLRAAWRAVDFLGRAARHVGVTGLDLRPSQEEGTGSGVLLPYRGADRDGLGVNPLYLPTGEPVSLDDTPDLPRVDAGVFTALGRRRDVSRFLGGEGPRPRPPRRPRLPPLPSVLGPDGVPERWAAELERVRDLWTEGRRHHLTLAVSAYGLALGLPGEQVQADLMAVIVAAGDPEHQERLTIIERTLERAAQGESLAYRAFYAAAGLDAPGGTTDAVRERIAVWLDALMTQPWPGKGGKTDRSLWKTLLGLSWRYGVLHPDGVELSVAWTQLLREADIGSEDTLSQGLARLEALGLLQRGRHGEGTKSGSFILLWANRSTLTTGGKITPEEFFGFTTPLRNGRGRLGKRAEQILDLIHWHGPQDRRALARHLRTRPADLHDLLDQMIDDHLLEEHARDGPLHLAEQLAQHLEARQHRDGTNVARDRQRALIQDRRERYRARYARRRRQR